MTSPGEALVEVRDLKVHFPIRRGLLKRQVGAVQAVDGVSFDIVDSGLSIAFIKNIIEKEKPKSLKLVSLLLKKGVPKIDFPVDYVGFEIPPDFVIGYGLDYAQKVRNLKSIYRLAPQGTNLLK